MDENIVLIGFMGSGKTSVGIRLSKGLKKEFIDMDDFIEKREGAKVSEIFKTKGEAYFRELEKDLCVRYSEPKGKVIATGGGVIKSEENVTNLKKGGIIIYLKCSSKQIAHNLRNDNSRPLLKVKDKEKKIAELLAQREPTYRKCADIIINVTNIDLNKTVEVIKHKLKLD